MNAYSAIIKTIVRTAKRGQLSYVALNFLQELTKNPLPMGKELNKLLSFWILNHRETPEGLAFETHCHSHFSDGPQLADVVDLLFDKKISFWSLTDHDNSKGFDSLVSGEYRLDKKYSIEANPDGRSLTIYCGDQSLVMLRSLEYSSNKGHIGIHGFRSNFDRKNLPLEEAIKRGVGENGFVIINHPYEWWSGVGFHGKGEIERSIRWGALGIEKSGAESLPLLFSAVRAQEDARHFGVPLVAGGDCHSLRMYGLSGLTFTKEDYQKALDSKAKNPAEAIKSLITENRFATYLNYITPRMVVDYFSG